MKEAKNLYFELNFETAATDKEVFSLYAIFRYTTDSFGKKKLLNYSNEYPSVESDFYNRYLFNHFKEENYLAMTALGENRYFYMDSYRKRLSEGYEV